MALASDLIISSDSHVMEPVDLWKKGVPEKYRETAPLFPPHQVGEGFQQHAGGWDPNARMKEMEADGLSAEVLYPTLMLDLFALDDPGLQEACFRVYNDWLIDYCSVDTNRLIGIPAIPVYDVDHGIEELERCHKAGLKGALIWQAPHPDLREAPAGRGSALPHDAPVASHHPAFRQGEGLADHAQPLLEQHARHGVVDRITARPGTGAP